MGGVGTAVDNAAVPPSLWAATLRYGYVGCMRDLVINSNAVDLAAFARQQDSGTRLWIIENEKQHFFSQCTLPEFFMAQALMENGKAFCGCIRFVLPRQSHRAAPEK